MRRGMTLARLLSLLLVMTATVSIAEAQNNIGRSARAKAAPKQPAAGKREFEGLALGAGVPRICRGELAKTVSSGDRAAVSALIDWDSVIDTAFPGVGCARSAAQGIKRTESRADSIRKQESPVR